MPIGAGRVPHDTPCRLMPLNNSRSGIMCCAGDAMTYVLLAVLVLGFLTLPGSAQIITTTPGPAGSIQIPLQTGADGEPITLPYVIETSPATTGNYNTNGPPLQISKEYNGFSGGPFIGYAGSIFPRQTYRQKSLLLPGQHNFGRRFNTLIIERADIRAG